MSRDDLHSVANADTPRDVEIPNTWQGLIVWAIARFGVGILVAGVFGYATKEIYADMRSDRMQLLEAYRDNTRAIQEFSSRIHSLQQAMDDAHRRASKP
jgi:Flp pilus assembly protein TadB